jgi:HEAT repeat protein
MAVLEVMGESGDPSYVDVARFVLETDQSPPLRAAAVHVIARANIEISAAMTRAMADLDPVVRAAAMEELTPGLGREADPFLLQGLSDGEEQVRRAAMNQLASREDSDHEFVWSALRQCRTEERKELGWVFSHSNQAALTELALMHYGSPDQEERVLALELAGWSGSQACLEASIQSLQDPVPAVRAAAASALGRLRDTSAVRALGNAIGDSVPEVRVEAVRALGVIDDEAVLGFLVAALQDADPGVRTVASEVLTQWSSPAVAKRLAGVLAVPNLRGAATDLLRKIGPSSQELLIDVLLHGTAEVVPIVGGLLGEVVGVARLAERLGSTEADARLRAVEAIGAIGGPDAVGPLIGVLSDPDERIRLRATQLLAALGDPRGADAIVEAVLNDPVPEVVAAAEEALYRLGVRSGDPQIT